MGAVNEPNGSVSNPIDKPPPKDEGKPRTLETVVAIAVILGGFSETGRFMSDILHVDIPRLILGLMFLCVIFACLMLLKQPESPKFLKIFAGIMLAFGLFDLVGVVLTGFDGHNLKLPQLLSA